MAAELLQNARKVTYRGAIATASLVGGGQFVSYVVGKMFDGLAFWEPLMHLLSHITFSTWVVVAALFVAFYIKFFTVDAPEVFKPNKYQVLAMQTYVFLEKLHEAKKDIHGRFGMLTIVLNQVNALLISYYKLGFVVPVPKGQYGDDNAFAYDSYFSNMAPLLNAGHEEEARQASSLFAKQAEDMALQSLGKW
jgi:hypothetical protein